MKILVTDGITSEGAKILTDAGHQVDKVKLTPEDLLKKIGDYDCIIVRSATKVTKEVIEVGKKLKVIARGGVGLDNIDVRAATEAVPERARDHGHISRRRRGGHVSEFNGRGGWRA